MKNFGVLFLLTVLLIACSPRQKLVNKTWYFRPTLSGKGIQIYQDSTLGIPPSRGITTYQFLENGIFVLYSPNANDKPQYDSGAWTMEKKQLALTLDKKKTTFTTSILELKKHLLKIEKPK